jgi:integrase
VGPWGSRPLKDIARRDVVALLREVAKERPYIAHHLLGYARKLYNWAIAQDAYGLETSPCDRIRAKDVIGEKKPRKRILADAELRRVWDGTGQLGYPLGPFVRLLLLSGQRLREVAEMAWDEIDLDKALWTIPAARMKGDDAHEVPLAPAAVALLRDLPRFSGPFVFTTTSGARPISGFSKAKVRLDAAMAKELGSPLPDWRFHDLRRTMRTHLGGLPVPSDVAEMVIAHRLGGVRGTYDLHAYRDEKRRALELWAARLMEVVEPAPGGNVVRFRA